MSELLSVVQQVDLCEICEEGEVTKAPVDTAFEYNCGGDIVEMKITVPVYSCKSCGSEYTGAEAEEIKHESICDYLHILTPKQIKTLRANYHMSRSEFSEATGIGSASISRWETGAIIQNKAHDNYLRLLVEKENMQKILEQNQEISIVAETPCFLALKLNDSMVRRSSGFQLR